MIEAILTNNKRRRWNPFRRRRFVLRIPQRWEEVTPLARRERWWRWVATLTPPEAKGRILRDLIPMPWRRKMLDTEQGAIVAHLEWVMPVPDAEVIPLESFYHRDIRYVFPKPKGQNVSCVEFALCDDYYKEFVGGDAEALLRVSACVWREEDECEREMLKRGDERVTIHSQAEVEARVVNMTGAPQEVHIQALMWWMGMKILVNRMYGKWLFEDDEDEEEEDEPATAEAPANTGPNFGWWGIFLDVAESAVFGPLEKVYQASIHDICIFLVKKRAEANRSPESPTPTTPPEED
jgi:hypothetical protein